MQHAAVVPSRSARCDNYELFNLWMPLGRFPNMIMRALGAALFVFFSIHNLWEQGGSFLFFVVLACLFLFLGSYSSLLLCIFHMPRKFPFHPHVRLLSHRLHGRPCLSIFYSSRKLFRRVKRPVNRYILCNLTTSCCKNLQFLKTQLYLSITYAFKIWILGLGNLDEWIIFTSLAMSWKNEMCLNHDKSSWLKSTIIKYLNWWKPSMKFEIISNCSETI